MQQLLGVIGRIVGALGRGLAAAWGYWMRDIRSRRSCAGKAASLGIGLFVLCCGVSAIVGGTRAAGETVGLVATRTATPLPTSTATTAPTRTPAPTKTLAPTRTPAPTDTAAPTDTPVPTAPPTETATVLLPTRPYRRRRHADQRLPRYYGRRRIASTLVDATCTIVATSPLGPRRTPCIKRISPAIPTTSTETTMASRASRCGNLAGALEQPRNIWSSFR